MSLPQRKRCSAGKLLHKAARWVVAHVVRESNQLLCIANFLHLTLLQCSSIKTSLKGTAVVRNTEKNTALVILIATNFVASDTQRISLISTPTMQISFPHTYYLLEQLEMQLLLIWKKFHPWKMQWVTNAIQFCWSEFLYQGAVQISCFSLALKIIRNKFCIQNSNVWDQIFFFWEQYQEWTVLVILPVAN